MIRNLNLLTVLFAVCCMLSCSSDDDVRHEDAKSISEELIGYRFVERKYDTHNVSLIGSYEAVSVQKEYTFKDNGTGNLDIYTAEQTDRGFSRKNKGFSWEVQNGDLLIYIDGGENIILRNVKIDEQRLKADGDILEKEIVTNNGMISKEDIISYKFYAESKQTTDMYGRIALAISPAKLVLKTKKGFITYITHEFGYAASLVGIPCYSDSNHSDVQYWDAEAYISVWDTDVTVSGEKYYNNRFCSFGFYNEKKDFTSNCMVFKVGEFDKDKQKVTLYENGKEILFK